LFEERYREEPEKLAELTAILDEGFKINDTARRAMRETG